MLGAKKGSIPEYKSLINHAVKYVIPSFERTYQVSIEVQPNGEKILKCRGGNKNSFPCHWCKHGRACEHMYRLLERMPTKRDALPRWHVDYLHFFGRDPIMTEHYTTLRDKVKMMGIPLTEPEIFHIEGLLPIGEGTQEEVFFTCSLDKIRLSGDTTYWHIIRDRLPTRLRQFIPLDVDDDVSQEYDDTNLSNDGQNYEGKIGNPDDGLHFEVATAAVGVGDNIGNEIVVRNSEYMVPSQLTQLSQQEDDNHIVPPQGENPHDDFMHMYQTICKTSDFLGRDGRRLMEEQLNIMNAKMIGIIARKNSSDDRRGDNSYAAFKHLYEIVSENCKEAGEEGRQAMADEMSNLKREQMELIATRGGSSERGLMSMPATSTKTIDKRIPSQCSPQKKGNK